MKKLPWAILLGRVFEELLAFYNPETQIAAKVQTGAFYTPPEIADYMIIESLRRYLENYLSENSIMPMCDASIGLEILLSYTEKDHPFSNSEAKHIVKAIDVCKIIDPACGSGVFLMGMLHKIEFILQKIDPDNKIWFNYMLQSFPSHLRDGMKIHP